MSPGGGVQRRQQVFPAPSDEADVQQREVEAAVFSLTRKYIHRTAYPSLLTRSLSDRRNFVLKHRVFLLRNWEKMRDKRELSKRDGERDREKESSLSQYARWGGVIRDDGNIKSGVCACTRVASTVHVYYRRYSFLHSSVTVCGHVCDLKWPALFFNCIFV